MTHLNKDVLIVGAGPAGLVAAAAFGTAGFSVVCVDPIPPVTTQNAPGVDLRTTAILQGSLPVLQNSGVWERLKPLAMPLETMRIVEAPTDTAATSLADRALVKDFVCSEISTAPFGWNISNWELRRVLLTRIHELETVDFRPGVALERLMAREDEALAQLSDGSALRLKLVVGADGRHSTVRRLLGIAAKTIDYGQKALVFSVFHERPHHNISTEVHLSGGPFTLVPLPDYIEPNTAQGTPQTKHVSAVVWVDKSAQIDRLEALDIAGFESALNARSAGILGKLRLHGRRLSWPIITQIAERMIAERVALIAEAAHVVPPIGAQGLNISLGDVGGLIELAKKDPAHLGNAQMLTRYQRARKAKINARVLGIDLLNRASIAGTPTLRKGRAAALDMMHRFPAVRQMLMRAGLGTH